jgi:hypothetical protein
VGFSAHLAFIHLANFLPLLFVEFFVRFFEKEKEKSFVKLFGTSLPTFGAFGSKK